MVSQCTNYEVSMFTSYDAMNGGAKCRKWGVLRTETVTNCCYVIKRINVSLLSTNIEML